MKSVTLAHLAFSFGVLAGLQPLLRAAGGNAGKVDFSRDIRPILSENCFTCHGPDGKRREADLRLDSRAGAFAPRQGRQTILPGKPRESELFRRIAMDDPAERMPPTDSERSLSADEIDLIRRWIEQGAEWEAHWSFIAPRRPELPHAGGLADRDHNEIDLFIQARLETANLSLSPEADRRTLIRRITLDLTGLPPTLDQMHAFLDDTSPEAYVKVVDRLLESPRFGEHMARFWLDAARYGDTHGLHLDNLRIMWPYRDWVIDAFNRGLAFDRFTVEQLAGDLLPKPTVDQRIATGFNRCNVTTSEGGAIAEEWLVRYAIDRVETTSTVWMGLSAGCAVCHEHKFDPVSQKEFYQLFAFFNNITEPAMDGNKSSVPPYLEVYLPGVKEDLDDVLAAKGTLEQRRARLVDAARPAFENWLRDAASTAGSHVLTPPGLVAHFPLDDTNGAMINEVNSEQKGSVTGTFVSVEGKSGRAYRVEKSHVDLGTLGDFEYDSEFSCGAWIRTPGDVTGSPVARVDSDNRERGWDIQVANRKVAAHLIHSWSREAIEVTTKEDVLEPDRWHHVLLSYDGSGQADGFTIHVDGEERLLETNKDSLGRKTVRTKAPLLIGQRSKDNSSFSGGDVDDLRIYDRALETIEVATIAGLDPIGTILATPVGDRTKKQTETLLEYYLGRFNESYRNLDAEIVGLRKRERILRTSTATTLVMKEREERRGAWVLERGQYDQRREEVSPATPASLPPVPADAPANRLGLARWLVDPSHPLTARVTVNRFWQQIFGTGIVKTAEDFGSQGEAPSHPRLLDWITTEFVRTGWDVKRLHRLMVMSATYRQSSKVTARHLATDPQNRLLARGPRYRLDAEMLRDQALHVSGLMVGTIGGPSVKPPQPEGLWYAVGYTSSNTARFSQDRGHKVYRRGLYTFWKRTAPSPAMSILDAPSREKCIVRRERTNTPLQALLLMNDRQYVEAARRLARRAIREGGDTPQERLDFVFEVVTGRLPEANDRRDLLVAYEGNLAEYTRNVDAARKLIAVGDSAPDPRLDPAELATWTMVSNVILNLDEAINKS